MVTISQQKIYPVNTFNTVSYYIRRKYLIYIIEINEAQKTKETERPVRENGGKIFSICPERKN